jgi:hypothetical protein
MAVAPAHVDSMSILGLYGIALVYHLVLVEYNEGVHHIQRRTTPVVGDRAVHDRRRSHVPHQRIGSLSLLQMRLFKHSQKKL